MPENIAIPLSLLITVTLWVVSLITFFKDRKRDIAKGTEEQIRSNVKLDELISTVSESRYDIKGLAADIKEIRDHQLKLDYQMTDINQRLDEDRVRITKLEDRLMSSDTK